MKNSKLSRKAKIILCILCMIFGAGFIIGALIVMYNVEKSDGIMTLYYLMDILGAIGLFVGFGFLYSLYKERQQKKSLSVREITMIGIMSAISVVLYYFAKFNLPFFPPWLDIQVSEIPALITGFAYGPYAGSLVLIVRFFIKLPATMTAGVGEFGDLVLGLILVLFSSILYTRKRTFKSALLGLILGVLCSTIGACIINWLVLIPAYINIAGFPMTALVGMLSYMGNVTESNFMLFYIFVGVLPFNLFRYILVVVVTIILYKKTHLLLNYLTSYDRKKSKKSETNFEEKNK